MLDSVKHGGVLRLDNSAYYGHKSWAWLIFILAATFYLYEFALQVSPSVMTAPLMKDLHVHAAGLGTMVAFYFYAYAPMQLPGGLLFDRFGPRSVMTAAVLVCAIGAGFFAHAGDAHLAALGRLFMGVGSACSFVGLLVLISRWFPPHYFAMLAGIAQLMGSVGAISGEVVLGKVVESFGWRATMSFAGMIGIVLALIVLLVIRNFPPGFIHDTISGDKKKMPEFEKLKLVLGRDQTWYIAAYAFTIWAPIVIFAAMWGVPYLEAYYHISASKAAQYIAMIWIGIGVGSPLFGYLSDYFKTRCRLLGLSAVLGLLSALPVLCLHHLSPFMMSVLLFFFGVGASGQTLSFAVVKDNNSICNVGTASGFNNMATVLGGAILQPITALILHHVWDGKMHSGIPIYSITAYRDALLLVPACFVVAFVLSQFVLKETHCHPYAEGSSIE